MGCDSGTEVSDYPPAIAQFFMGTPVKDSKAFAAVWAEGSVTAFQGPHAPKTPEGGEVTIKGEEMEQVVAGIIGGFSDFCFNEKKADWVQRHDGCWINGDMYQFGTHDGPFSPMPGLAPIAATGKQVREGPEKFTITLDAQGKISKMIVEALTDGPSGPPGFYVLVGGKLP